MALKSSSLVDLKALLSAAIDLGSRSGAASFRHSMSLADGSGLNQANLCYADTRTIAGAEDIDVAGGGLLGLDGLALASFVRVKGIAVKCPANNPGNVIVGGDANGLINWLGAATHTISVRPGGLMLWLAPDAVGAAVTAGTGDIIQVAPSAGSCALDIVIIGAAS